MSVRIAVAGVGGCAAALTQGCALYAADPAAPGLMTRDIGSYGPGSVQIVAAFDVSAQKVGKDLHAALLASPNVPMALFPLPPESGVIVRGGPVADGVGRSLSEVIPRLTPGTIDEVAQHLVDTETDVLVNFLPVGSDKATRLYASAALAADVAFVNGIPVKIANDPDLVAEFEAQGLPLIGDDVKSMAGATITHRALVQMLAERGVHLERTYQINVGGNADFRNMLDEERLETKRWSKTRAVTDVANGGGGLSPDQVYIGPSGYIPFLGDDKIAHMLLQGSGFAGNPLEIEVRYRSGDSPNSAGVIYDCVRWAKLARDAGVGGLLEDVCGVYMKAPPVAMTDAAARSQMQARMERWVRV